MSLNGYTICDMDAKEILSQLDQNNVKDNLQKVYDALCEKGYDPVAQIIGYVLSEDPTYITSYNNARSIMSKMDRFDVLHIVLSSYFEHQSKYD